MVSINFRQKNKDTYRNIPISVYFSSSFIFLIAFLISSACSSFTLLLYFAILAKLIALSRVKQSFYKNKDGSVLDKEGNTDWKKVYSLYGTTLLGMLITDTFVFSFQIGDGDINYITGDEISPLVEPEKFLGTETHSLSKLDAWRKAVASVRRKNAADDVPYLYMLSTDGFSNSFVNEEEFHKTCREYYKMIGEHGYEAVRDNLEKWLKETSELGCGDDVTVVMAYVDK